MTKKNNKKFTPNEINKYLYCPYQWYYEKKYGTKTLRSLYKERNEKLNLDDKLKSNFAKGNKYHSNYLDENKNENKNLLVYLMIVVVIFILWYFLFNGS